MPKTFATKTPDPALVSSKPLFVNIDMASLREGRETPSLSAKFRSAGNLVPGRRIPLSIICSIWLTTNKDNLLLGIFSNGIVAYNS